MRWTSKSYLYIVLWLAGALLAASAVDSHLAAVAQTIPSTNPVYLPVVMNPPQPTATPEPTRVPNVCKNPPSLPVNAADYPIKIVGIDKRAEEVQLQNISNESVDLAGWRMCSVLGTQEHKPIGGILNAGETRVYKNGEGNIWRNDLRDDGALYNELGQLVSYWNDLE